MCTTPTICANGSIPILKTLLKCTVSIRTLICTPSQRAYALAQTCQKYWGQTNKIGGRMVVIPKEPKESIGIFQLLGSACPGCTPVYASYVPLQWLVPQFGMASLCLSAHSLELFLRHSFLNLRRFYLVVLGLGAPL